MNVAYPEKNLFHHLDPEPVRLIDQIVALLFTTIDREKRFTSAFQYSLNTRNQFLPRTR